MIRKRHILYFSLIFFGFFNFCFAGDELNSGKDDRIIASESILSVEIGENIILTDKTKKEIDNFINKLPKYYHIFVITYIIDNDVAKAKLKEKHIAEYLEEKKLDKFWVLDFVNTKLESTNQVYKDFIYAKLIAYQFGSIGTDKTKNAFAAFINLKEKGVPIKKEPLELLNRLLNNQHSLFSAIQEEGQREDKIKKDAVSSNDVKALRNEVEKPKEDKRNIFERNPVTFTWLILLFVVLPTGVVIKGMEFNLEKIMNLRKYLYIFSNFGLKKKPYLKSENGLRGIYLKKKKMYLILKFAVLPLLCYIVVKIFATTDFYDSLYNFFIEDKNNNPSFIKTDETIKDRLQLSFMVLLYIVSFFMIKADRLINLFICPVCLKTIFTNTFNITCPFCDGSIGDNESYIFNKHKSCKSVLKFVSCPQCKSDIDLFRPYDEELYERRRYERT